jgi:filamentous hemagglutinin
MKSRAVKIILIQLICFVWLMPCFCEARSVKVPGFSGPVVPRVSPSQQPPLPSVSIPGFYGPSTAPPSRTQLPVLKQPAAEIPGISGFESNPSQNQLIIFQEQPNVVIDWEGFNIGADAWMKFDQKGNSDWTALNRIFDANPSLIFGKLTADGRIYLINQNGILFGSGSRVNVNSLVASALNISSSDFMSGFLNFSVETELSSDDRAAVSNHGEINAAAGGSVFMIGPRVENFGTINAPAGQIGLAAGTHVALIEDPTGQRRAFIVDVRNAGSSGEAWNREGGQLISDTGLIGMYGRIVNHDGIIRSVTAVKQNGQVELRATEKISTGSNSIIESPISNSSETVDNSFPFYGGQIWMDGIQAVASNDNVDFIMTKAAPEIVELKGSIEAPSGWVNIKADQRVFLENGSRINVGGAWSDETASANIVQAQLNSFELRDSYGQKGGPLQGQSISANVLAGSSIGDISRAILSKEKTALEKSINGGNIEIAVNKENGDIIVKEGVPLDFSGGGINYVGGALDTTKLLSGTRIYDIGNAPLSIKYDNIMGQYKKTYDRFGITDSYSGIYYGGASPLRGNTGSFSKGGDAGSLQLAAGTIVLDGQLNGSVTQGLFQTSITPLSTTDYQNALQLSREQGLEVPKAGVLKIGQTSDSSSRAVHSIEVRSDTVSLPPDFNSDARVDNLSGRQTVISSRIINDSSLGSLNLIAGNEITTAGDAHILLSPGGNFSAIAARIEHSGDVTVPGGIINLATTDNISGATSGFSGNREIYLSAGSSLNVAGEKVDNSRAGKISGEMTGSGRINGGTITIMDQTGSGRGVFVADGASLDVSGGYQIDHKSRITGGNAGTLEVRGSTLMLEGDIKGYAIADSQGKIKGGQIILHADEIDITASRSPWPFDFTAYSQVPAYLQGKLVLAGDYFADTGFTRIELESFNDITIDPFAVVAPSLVRLKTPLPGIVQGFNTPVNASAASGEPVFGHKDLTRLSSYAAYEAGPTALRAVTGRLFPWQDSQSTNANTSAALTVSPEAVIRMAPEGKINLSASGAITVAGLVESPSGQISITAGTGGMADLVMKNGSRVNAGGYNRPDNNHTLISSAHSFTPVDGGDVSLRAANGNLSVEEGATINVSGSHLVGNTVLSGGKVISYNEAGNAGSLSLTYLGDLDLNGSVNARTKIDGLKGGTLNVSRTDTDPNKGIVVSADEINNYLVAGFDDITLRSPGSLRFEGSADISVSRRLTLDAPEVSASGDDSITLRSPWITLVNSYYPASGTPAAGSAYLSLESSGWLDLSGSINLSGFHRVNLEASRDIRLTDRYYTVNSPVVWQGKMTTAGDLILKAGRVYPETLSDYILQSTGGKATILPADIPAGGPVFSAGGNLTVEALEGIEVRGILAAPQGTVTLRGTGAGSRIYLAEGGEVTTYSNAIVNFGSIDVKNNNSWVLQDKITGAYDQVSTSPDKSVTIDAPEIIIRSGANIDVSGGGAIFAYDFQPGVEGSINPLTKTGRYVIMRNRSVLLPGEAVYLTGGAGLSEGLYSLLPVDYAFLPGAIVIEELKIDILPGQNIFTKDGFPVVAGYSAVAGTEIRDIRPTAYAVRNAADVLSEGHFDIKARTAGNAGDVTVAGRTTIIDGQMRATALADYNSGRISLSATDVQVQPTSVPLPAEFDFGTSLDSSAELQQLHGRLNVAASSLSGRGFKEITLGDSEITNTVVIREGSIIEAPVISLNAREKITIESEAQLQALVQSGLGEININTPAGTAAIEEGALLHASHSVNLNAGNQDFRGGLKVDNSALTLKGIDIVFVPDGYSHTGQGIFITDSSWRQYSMIEDITLQATGYTDPMSKKFITGDIRFMDSFGDLSATGSITLDAARIVNISEHNDNDGKIIQAPVEVALTAPVINLVNSAGASNIMPDPNGGAGTFTAAADNIIVGGGDVLFANFASIKLDSQNDITLKGIGSLTTGNAELNMNSARLTTASTAKTINNSDGTTSTPITSPNFIVYTGANYFNEQNNLNPANAIRIGSSGTTVQSSDAGGVLEIWGTSIDHAGTIMMDGGRIKLVATGADSSDGIFMRSGSSIIASGNDLAPGGLVTLRTEHGNLVMEPDSFIDVSSGAQGDAGRISLIAPLRGIVMDGNLKGNPLGGIGGSLVFETKQLSGDDLESLIRTISSGGFTETLDLRARLGDISINGDQSLTARNIRLTADDESESYGRINIAGTIESSSGGRIELYAMNDLNVQPSGWLVASGSETGGDVLLSSSRGWVNVNGSIDVSGSTEGSAGGRISMRALRSDSDLQMNFNGTVNGASAVYAEAFKVYDDITVIDSEIIDFLNAETQEFMSGSDEIKSRLLENPDGLYAENLHLLPGIEVRSSGDMKLNANWDLTAWRDGGEPGVLTIRAADNLYINANLVDHPTPVDRLTSSYLRDSWAINLTAGADLSRADSLGVNRYGRGTLTIQDQRMVYSESAPIRFASGGDTVIGRGQDTSTGFMINNTMRYNLASYEGSIQGYTGRDLSIEGGAIQTATGDINISVSRDLILLNKQVAGFDTLGTIRTTGQTQGTTTSGLPALTSYWNYAEGGNITLDVGRNAGKKSGTGWIAALSDRAWDWGYGSRQPYIWGPAYENTGINYGVTSGIVTMGGGDIVVDTGGDFLSQTGTFGAGDLSVYAGGNIRGRFLNRQGNAEIHAMGNFGDVGAEQVIEAFDSRINVSARGDIQLGTVVNPTIANAQFAGPYWNLTYSKEASLRLKAGGNVTMTGSSQFHRLSSSFDKNQRILPATLDIEAGGDIRLRNDFALAPSNEGNLRLIAGGDIDGSYTTTYNRVVSSDRSSIHISDMDPENAYIPIQFTGLSGNFADMLFNPYEHAALPIHRQDFAAVEINAGRDIRNVKFFLPKKAEIQAGRDIRDIYYFGQNLNAGDFSLIRAGNDISLSYLLNSDETGIWQAGPGAILLQAGNSIDLGSSHGIQSIGNQFNPVLGTQGSSILVLSGYSSEIVDIDLDEAGAFFEALREEGAIYSLLRGGAEDREQAESIVNNLTTNVARNFIEELRAQAGSEEAFFRKLVTGGNNEEAEALIQKARYETIEPLLGPPSKEKGGDINMTSTQIATNYGKSDIFIFARGEMNVGRSTFFTNESDVQNTGILTSSGGAINIFSNGDVNVNESRVMTFLGGDISVWSDQGNVNAGRGSKTAINPSAPRRILIGRVGDRDIYAIAFSPPSVGSGIRALTYDPDGVAGPLKPPAPGDVYLFAARGTIDAGEAGIAGGKVVLGATQVLNAQNISFAAGSVGVPAAATAGTSGIGTLSGTGTVAAQNVQLASDATGLASANAAQAAQMIDDIMTKWLDVKVIEFSEEKLKEDKEE